ncbi:MAG: bifunctional 5,10-methylenetetrahydrofolate dehydrogenase/5,10-methenyltetrahydrofolate cyclohydrolase [Eubacteriales bacterium]|nr:bifunctional 5,10-methylenetetrahydrofolate dehydrogenase/5,10-methenyltetrahydrofolate cyclohydrolase [Eubacteriales bacterium]
MLLKGKEVADKINEEILTRIERIYEEGIVPTLAIIRVGNNPSDIAYENGAIKKANMLGIKVEKFIGQEDILEEDLIEIVKALNKDNDIHGILVLRPLPKHIDDDKIRNTIAPEKDIDGISDLSMAGVFTNTNLGFPPCTAEAAVSILKHYNIDLAGKKVVVIGRSLVIGKPVAMMLLNENSTVTICHSRTPLQQVEKLCREADIIVTAVGKIGTVTSSHVNGHQIIVDVGINFDENGKMVGDANAVELEDHVKGITPVPGGVGSVTTSILMSHVIKAIK